MKINGTRFALFITCLAITLGATGCPSQVTPSPIPTPVVTWTSPATCTASNPSCTYIVSRCAVATGQTTCPSYTPLNQSSPASTATFTDTTAPSGQSVLYVVQAVQNSLTGQVSASSNSGVPFPIPVYPGTPGMPSVTQSIALAPPLEDSAQPIVASADIPVSNVKVSLSTR